MKTTLTALRIFIVLTIITGVIYPLLVTGVGQTLFKRQSQGSLLTDKTGQVIGSELISQSFTDAKYFWPRPSGASYNPLPSSGSNFGPTSADLKKQVVDRKKTLIDASPDKNESVPANLLFASGSGLDPHISPEAALYQVSRIATTRGVSASHVNDLVATLTENRTFGFLGEPRVNVLKMNLELDRLFP